MNLSLEKFKNNFLQQITLNHEFFSFLKNVYSVPCTSYIFTNVEIFVNSAA